VNPELWAAEDAAALVVARKVLDGDTSAVAYGRGGAYQVAAVAVELDRHPSGVRRVAPSVVCSFHQEQWLRICCLLGQLRSMA
jgi:hypothetical protein